MVLHKGWLMAKGNKYLWVQIGSQLCRVYCEHNIDLKTQDGIDFFKKFMNNETIYIAKEVE